MVSVFLCFCGKLNRDSCRKAIPLVTRTLEKNKGNRQVVRSGGASMSSQSFRYNRKKVAPIQTNRGYFKNHSESYPFKFMKHIVFLSSPLLANTISGAKGNTWQVQNVYPWNGRVERVFNDSDKIIC